jgi:hypothetical protein
VGRFGYSARFIAFYAPTCNASTNEPHPFYGIFMSRILTIIFVCDLNDVEMVKRAKFSELKLTGISNPSPVEINFKAGTSSTLST